MIGSSFCASGTEDPQIAPTTTYRPAGRGGDPAGSVSRPHVAILDRRVSDKAVLCQLDLDLQAGLDSCPQLG